MGAITSESGEDFAAGMRVSGTAPFAPKHPPKPKPLPVPPPTPEEIQAAADRLLYGHALPGPAADAPLLD